MMYYNLANMTYCNMTNKELLDAYNASAEYDESMCCEICTRRGRKAGDDEIIAYYHDGEF